MKAVCAQCMMQGVRNDITTNNCESTIILAAQLKVRVIPERELCLKLHE